MNGEEQKRQSSNIRFCFENNNLPIDLNLYISTRHIKKFMLSPIGNKKEFFHPSAAITAQGSLDSIRKPMIGNAMENGFCFIGALKILCSVLISTVNNVPGLTKSFSHRIFI